MCYVSGTALPVSMLRQMHHGVICPIYVIALQTHLERWSKIWELSIAEQRTLYLAAAEVLRLSKVRCLSTEMPT